MTIMDQSTVTICAKILYRNLHQIKVGMPATVTFPALSDECPGNCLHRLSNRLIHKQILWRSVDVKVVITQQTLLFGMSASVRIPVRSNALRYHAWRCLTLITIRLVFYRARQYGPPAVVYASRPPTLYRPGSHSW